MGDDITNFEKSNDLASRLAQVVPGGSHTYAKGSDQYPQLSPGVLTHGRGCRVWDVDGNEYIEYGMGLRSVTLGHAYPEVIRAVRDSLELGTNFTRPAAIELAVAERFLEVIHTADMVKFTKDGSTATSGALKLARKATGRDCVAVCADHPFFSYDDWFMSTTTFDGGIPSTERQQAIPFGYNDLASLHAAFDSNRDQIAAVFLEVVRTEEPVPGFLEGVRSLCDEHGTALVFDEMITGFRYDLHGAHHRYGVTPDLMTYGKAVANGFAVSVLAGKRDLMRYGSRERPGDDVFLLSGTHSAETPGLAAALATIDIYCREPVIQHLDRQGRRLAAGLTEAAARYGLSDHVFPVGFPCNLMYATLGPDHKPSQSYRSLFLQEVIRRGILMPSLVTSYSHADDDVDRTIEAIDAALSVYAQALTAGSTDGLLTGKPSRPVMARKFR